MKPYRWMAAATVAAALAAAGMTGRPAWAVYMLGLWHYAVYVLAFTHRAVPHRRFMQDALAAKTLAMLVFVWTWLPAGPHPLSVITVAAGFALNAWGAAVLGTKRTHYGHERLGLPFSRIERAPFSFTAHPMLYGNVIAFAGSLLDPAFRSAWWPLAVLHIAMNLLLLAMERVGPACLARIRFDIAVLAGLALGGTALAAGSNGGWPVWVSLAMTLSFAGLLYPEYRGVEETSKPAEGECA